MLHIKNIIVLYESVSWIDRPIT